MADSFPTPIREAHAHIAWHGRVMDMLNLGSCRSVEECLELVRRESHRLTTAGATEWLMGIQLRIESWETPRWPTRHELDEACPDRACWLLAFDHHSLAANTRALAAAGLSDASADPPGGVLVRDASGQLTGVCLEAAAGLVRAAAPPASRAEFKAHVRLGLADLARHGFVEIHDLLAQEWLPEVLAELHDEGSLPVRVGIYTPLDHLDRLASTRQHWQRPGLSLMGGKVFVDGTLNARTAWSLTPYADGLPDHPHGTPLMSVEQIAAAITRCRALGLGMAAHAIGDGAVRACLDAAERAGPAPAGMEFRIEHAEVVDEADVPRFAKLGVIASVQPCHLLYDIEALQRSLPHRLDRVLPLRDFIHSGLVPGRTLLFGSDTPIVRPDPADSIQAATQRSRHDSGIKIAPEQALTLAQAQAAFAV